MGRESVSLWSALPRAFSRNDPDGIFTAFVRVCDAALRARWDEITSFRRLRNPLTCDPEFLPVIAQDYGWLLDTTLPVALQRKVVSSLVPLYRLKGTVPGIENAMRLFFGEEVSVRTAWSTNWQLGRSHLGGLSVRYVASGGEQTIDVSAIDERWNLAAHTTALRAWRNGVELSPHQVYPISRTSVALLCEGMHYVARGGETALDLPFAYYGRRDALRVERNGLRIDQPTGWSELTGGSMYYTRITLGTTLARGDVVTVWHLENRASLNPADEIILRTTACGETRLAAPLSSDRAFRILVRVPRALSDVEMRAALNILNVMRPSIQRVELYVGTGVMPRFILGESRLGRESRLG